MSDMVVDSAVIYARKRMNGHSYRFLALHFVLGIDGMAEKRNESQRRRGELNRQPCERGSPSLQGLSLPSVRRQIRQTPCHNPPASVGKSCPCNPGHLYQRRKSCFAVCERPSAAFLNI